MEDKTMYGKPPPRGKGMVCGILFVLMLLVTTSAFAADLTDISQHVSITTANERTTLDRVTRTLTSTVDVIITNTSDTAIGFPIQAVIDIQDTDYTNVQMPGALGGPGTEPYHKYYFEIGTAAIEQICSGFGRSNCQGDCPGDLDRDGDVDGYDLALAAGGNSFDPGRKISFHLTFVRGDDIRFSYNVVPYGVLEAGPVNHSPIVDAGGPYSGIQGKSITFDGSGCSDPDGDFIYFLWDFGDGQSSTEQSPVHVYENPGQYTVLLTIKDSKGASASAQGTVTVTRLNHGPVFSPFPEQVGQEGTKLSLEIAASDEDGDPLVYSAANLPAGAYFDSPSHVLTWTPGYDQAGTYTITFTATDPGGLSSATDVSIVINNTNRPPVIQLGGNRTVPETKTLTFAVSGADPDNDPLTFSSISLPPGASFDPATHSFSWTPGKGVLGTYSAAFSVSDGQAQDSGTVQILVIPFEGAASPSFAPIQDRVVNEGENISFTVAATDPNNDPLTYSATGLPQGASFDPSVQTFSWTPTYSQSGSYTVHFKVTDPGGLSDEADVAILVEDVNRAPMLEAAGPYSIAETKHLTFEVAASDPDQDPLTYSVDAGTLPQGASFDASGRRFSWTPGDDQAGEYVVTFLVSDGKESDSMGVQIRVVEFSADHGPSMAPIGAQAVDEAQPLTFDVVATDPDGDALTIQASTLPQGAAFDPDGTRENTYIFSWTPGYDQAGDYLVTFTASDPQGNSDAVNVNITVNNINRPPLLDSIPNQSIEEGKELTVQLSAVDPDGDLVSYGAENLPNGALLDPQTGLLSWTPGYDQAGSYGLTVLASDGELSDQKPLSITVTDVNRGPAITTEQLPLAAVDQLYHQKIEAQDPDGDPLTYTLTQSTAPLSMDPSTGVISWRPGIADVGTYTLTVAVSDGKGGSASKSYTLSVPDTIYPSIALNVPKEGNPGTTFTAQVLASDNVGISSIEIGGQSIQFSQPFPKSMVQEREITLPSKIGAFTIEASAVDPTGNRSNTRAVVNVVAKFDNTPPQVSIKVPPRAHAGQAILLTAQVTDDNGVSEVTFYEGSTPVGSPPVSSPVLEYVVPQDAVQGSTIIFKVEAKDFSGNRASDQDSTQVVAESQADLEEPDPQVSAPEEAGPDGSIPIEVQTPNETCLARIDVYVNHTLAATYFSPDATSFEVPPPAGVEPGMDVVVEVVVTDCSGNQSTVTTDLVSIKEQGKGIIAGEVYDDTTGLALANAHVTVYQDDEAVGSAETDSRGYFSLEVSAGPARLVISKQGFSRVERVGVEVPGDGGIEVFDARLTPLSGDSASVVPAAGVVLDTEFSLFRAGVVPVLGHLGVDTAAIATGKATLDIPGGAIASQQNLTITHISPQALQGLLPAGWSPVGVLDLSPHGIEFQVPATLRVPNVLNVDEMRTLVLAKWDNETHAWMVHSDVSHSGDNNELSAQVNSTGQFAFVLADNFPVAPPNPVIGQLLEGIERPSIPQQVSTIITPQPKIIFYRPGVQSQVGMVVSWGGGLLSSGAPCYIALREEYDFYSATKVVAGPYEQDVFLYSMGQGFLSASYPVSPSMEFEALSLKKGIIHVDALSPEGPQRELHVVGPEGGTVALDTGQGITIPSDALSDTIPVDVQTIDPDDPSIIVPDGFTFVGALNVSLAGRDLNVPATLTIPLPDSVSPDGQFLLVEMMDAGGNTQAALVGMGTVENGTVVSAREISQESDVALPGVVLGGRYVFVKAGQAMGFAAGAVYDPEGMAKPGALVTSSGISLASLSGQDGQYVAGVPVGAFTLRAVDLDKLDSGHVDASIQEASALVTADIFLVAEPPRVVEVIPQNGSSNVALETSIRLTFSEPLAPESVSESSIVLTGPDGPVVGTIDLASSNTVVVFRPVDALAPNVTYTITALTQIRDMAGYSLESPFSASFTSLDTTPPPPPPAAQVNATIPREQGKTTVTGTQGTAGVHDTVTVINKTKNISQPALVQADGSFSTTIQAGLTDEIVISITDSAGNETAVPVGPFRDPDGSTVIGPQGEILDAENGVVVEIPEGAFPDGAIVKLTPLSEADIPVSPGPDFPFVAAFEIETSVYPAKYFNVSAPLPSPPPGASTGIVARLVNLYGGEAHLSIVDTAKVENGRLVTSSPPCPGVKGYYRNIYVMYLNMAANMINSFVKISFSAIGHFALGGGIGSFGALTYDVLSELYDYTVAAVEIYSEQMKPLYPFLAAINGADPYACMVIPPNEGFKAVIRDPETREVIDYIDIDPIEPFGHAHFDFSVAKKHDVFAPEVASIEPVSRVLVPGSSRISLRFSEPVDHMALLGAGEKDIYLTLKDNDSIYYTGTWELREDNTLLVFEPHQQLPLGKTFILHLENIRDLAGNSYDGPGMEIKTYKPEIIFPSAESQFTRSKIAQDLGVSIDQVPDELWISDLDYSTRGPRRSYDGRWHTDIVAIQQPDYLKSGANTYRLFKIDATDPTSPTVTGGFRTDYKYTQTRIKLVDNVLLPPRPDFQGDPWWKRKVLVYSTEDPSINFCWDPSAPDQASYNEWVQRHCDQGCESITGGCGDLAVVTGYGTGASGTSYSMLFPYEVSDPDNISWIGWRFLSDAGYGMYIRSDVPVGVGWPEGLILIPGMDITHGDKAHTDTIGAFVANYGVGLQLVDLGLNMPGIGDEERQDQSLAWAPVERLHMTRGSYFKDVALVPSRVKEDGTRVPTRIATLAFDKKSSSTNALQIFIPGQGDAATGTKGLTRGPEHIAVAPGIPVKNYDTNEVVPYDLAVITFTKDTGGGILLCEIPDDGSSPTRAQYIQMPVGTKFVDVDSGAQLAYVGASGIDPQTGSDGIVIVDISNPFDYVGDKDGDGWDDRVIGKVALRIASYRGPVYSWGLKVDPERGLVYAAIYAGGEQGLAILKVRECPDLGVDFKEVRSPLSLPEDIVKQAIAQIFNHALSGSGMPEGSLAVVAYGEGACVWRGDCDPTVDLDSVPYRFAVLVPEAQWDKKDLLINTLVAQVRDEATGEAKKVVLEGSDVFVKLDDIEFVPLKYEEFINADLSIDFNQFDYGLARQTLLLEILLTGAYVDAIPGAATAAVPLELVLSNLASSCSVEECGSEAPSHIWPQEAYEAVKLALVRFLEQGLLIRINGESEGGTWLRKRWKADLRYAAALALRAALAHMIATEDGNRFVAFRADTYGMAESGVAPSQSADPSQWSFESSIRSFEHWIATVAALSVRDNVGVLSPENMVNLFDFLAVFQGEKVFVSEQEANAFIAKCYNYIQQELSGIAWSVYQARLMDDPRATQRHTNDSGAEGAVIDFRDHAQVNLVPRLFNQGEGSGSGISVKMYTRESGSWQETAHKDIDLEPGSEISLPEHTFTLTGINQGDPTGGAGWVAFTIDLPGRKMRDGNRHNNWINIYYYVLDPANPVAPDLPPEPELPVPDPKGDMLDPTPECECDLPLLRLSATLNGQEETVLEPGECTDIIVNVQNEGTKPITNVTIRTNLPGFGDWSYDIANLDAGATVQTMVHFCAPEDVGGYRALFWFEENDPEYDPPPASSDPLDISVVGKCLHVDGKANQKDEVFVAPGESVEFSVIIPAGECQNCSYLWDLGDGQGFESVSSFTYSYDKAGTYYATIFAASEDGVSGKDRVLVHVVDLEILVNETLDDPGMVGDPGEVDDLVRLKAEFPDAEDPASLPTKVFFTPCTVRLKTPLSKAVPITIQSDSMSIGFSESHQQSMSKGEDSLELVVPKNGDPVRFFITGEQPSLDLNDAVVQVWNRDKSYLLGEEDLTVFWFDDVQMEVVPIGDYQLGDSKDYPGEKAFYAVPRCVMLRAKATLRPEGVSCEAPQISSIRLGIVQNDNAGAFRHEDYYTGQVEAEFFQNIPSIDVPATRSKIATWSNLDPGLWLLDSSLLTFPLYHKCLTLKLDLICRDCSFDMPYLKNRPPSPCEGSDFLYHGGTEHGTWAVDTPSKDGIPVWFDVTGPDGNTVIARYKYSNIGVRRTEVFRCWAVTVTIKDKEIWEASDACGPYSIPTDEQWSAIEIVPIMENGWSLDIDTLSTDPAKTRAQRLSAYGFEVRHAPVLTRPLANEVEPVSVSTESDTKVTIANPDYEP